MTLSVEYAKSVDSVPRDRVRLYKNDFTPTIDSEVSDFTEADFSGYSGESVSGSTGLDANGYPVLTDPAYVFQHNGGATMNTIYGFYIVNTNTTPERVEWAERFSTPIDMEFDIDVISLTLGYRFGD